MGKFIHSKYRRAPPPIPNVAAGANHLPHSPPPFFLISSGGGAGSTPPPAASPPGTHPRPTRRLRSPSPSFVERLRWRRGRLATPPLPTVVLTTPPSLSLRSRLRRTQTLTGEPEPLTAAVGDNDIGTVEQDDNLRRSTNLHVRKIDCDFVNFQSPMI